VCGADGGGARVEGCGEDAVLVELAFGVIFEVLSERRGGVKRNSRGGGKVVFGVVPRRRFGAGFRARAGADGVGCFKRGDGGVVVGTGPVWARGAEIPVEGKLGRIDHRGHRGHGEGVGQRSSSWNGIAMEVGRLGEPSLGVSLGAAAPRAERN